MFLAVGPARMLSLLTGLRRVPVRRVGVMGRFLVTSSLMVFCSFIVMTSCMSVMFGCGLVMFGCFLGHRKSPSLGVVITAGAGSAQPIRLLPYRSSNERAPPVRANYPTFHDERSVRVTSFRMKR